METGDWLRTLGAGTRGALTTAGEGQFLAAQVGVELVDFGRDRSGGRGSGRHAEVGVHLPQQGMNGPVGVGDPEPLAMVDEPVLVFAR